MFYNILRIIKHIPVLIILPALFVWLQGCHNRTPKRQRPVSAISKKSRQVFPSAEKSTPLSGKYFDYGKASVSVSNGSVTSGNIRMINGKSGSLKKQSLQSGLIVPAGDYAMLPKRKISRIFQIDFDNDIFDNTDYYYTNGVKLSLVTPAAGKFFLSRMLWHVPHESLSLFGFSLRQNMYTPINPDVPVILTGDHPFAGYLVLGQFLHSVDMKHRLSLFSEIRLGVIGPASLAGSIQYSVHEIKPVGWINQIRNDIIINYDLHAEKALMSTTHTELNLTGGIRAGTLHDDFSGGLFFRTGTFMPVYRGMWLKRYAGAGKQLQYWFFIKGSVRGVLYDATLQGGLFSESPYTLDASMVNRTVVKASAGLAVYYGTMGLEFENFYQSPEFKGAVDFRWGRIKVVFGF